MSFSDRPNGNDGSAGCETCPTCTKTIGGAGLAANRGRYRKSDRRVHHGLLVDLVLPAEGSVTVGAAGHHPECGECACPEQDRQARCGVVGQSHREGLAVINFRAIGQVLSTAARLHSAVGGSDPQPHPLLAAG